MRTWLAERGLPDSEVDAFTDQTSDTSVAAAEYLCSVKDAIEALYDAGSQLVTRPFKGKEMVVNRPRTPDTAQVLANYLPSETTEAVNL